MSDLYGLFGEKLGHSISPKIHSLLFEKLKLQGYYHLFELGKGELRTALEGLRALRAKGINVTIPYKIEVMPFLDDISKEAKEIGSVNTIKFEETGTKGYNTDYYGFGMTLKKYGITVEGKKVVVLGSGGVAATILQYLSDERTAKITVVGRDISKLEKNGRFQACTLMSYNELGDVAASDIVINCTPVGMFPNKEHSPLSQDIMKRFDTAIDLIYNPPKTLFLKYAEKEGLISINGLYMLVGQAVKAQEIWNNIKIPNNIIDEVYDTISKEFEK